MSQNRPNLWYRLFSWINTWSNPIQVLVNSVLTFLTLSALLVTIYYSSNNLIQSNKQFDFAQRQFQLSIHQRYLDSIKSARKDFADSILSKQHYDQQQHRNRIQDSINSLQLSAFQEQTKISHLQYKAQESLNKQSAYQNRPIFIIKNVQYDTVSHYELLTIQNTGKRPAKIIESTVYLFDGIENIFNHNHILHENSEVNDAITVTLKVPSSPSIFKYYGTMNYISFNYLDGVGGSVKVFTKYFYWKINDDNTIGWNNLSDRDIVFFKDRAKLHNLPILNPSL